MNLQDDRVIRFLDECYAAGIKRPEQFILAKMPQVYSWLKGAFPRGILPTDIDGEVEINGHFLRFEFKHENAIRSGAIPKGQMMALSALITTGRFTVLLVGVSELGIPSCYEVWFHNGAKRALQDCKPEDLRELCAKWAKYAESQPKSR